MRFHRFMPLLFAALPAFAQTPAPMRMAPPAHGQPPLKPSPRPNPVPPAVSAQERPNINAGPWLWRYRLAGDSLRPLAAAAARDRALLWLAVAGRDGAGALAPTLLRFTDEAGIRQPALRYPLQTGAELRGDYPLAKMAGGPAGGIQTVVALAPLTGGRVLLFVTGPATRLLSARFDPETGKLDGLAPVAPGGEPLSGVTVAVAPNGAIAVTGLGEARHLIAWYSPEGKLLTQAWLEMQSCSRGGDGAVLASAAMAGNVLSLLARVENCNSGNGLTGGGLRILTVRPGSELQGGAAYPDGRDGQLVMAGRTPLVILRQQADWRVLDASAGALVSVDRPLASQYLQGGARIAAAVPGARAGAWLAANLESGTWLAQLNEAGLLATESLTPRRPGAGDPLLAAGGKRLYLIAPLSLQQPDGGEQPAFDIFAYLDNN